MSVIVLLSVLYNAGMALMLALYLANNLLFAMFVWINIILLINGQHGPPCNRHLELVSMDLHVTVTSSCSNSKNCSGLTARLLVEIGFYLSSLTCFEESQAFKIQYPAIFTVEVSILYNKIYGGASAKWIRQKGDVGMDRPYTLEVRNRQETNSVYLQTL
ncbi:hypothetical protein RRG08_019957 [Elysia crispata]|uniref:Uncharacterized protein n=1 Tax=Elysia crispata TaxID=231223 RepID=A0AAE1CZK5_9GAST|nr:hypothetical protein RRG08_019957 [Elysia crispata]